MRVRHEMEYINEINALGDGNNQFLKKSSFKFLIHLKPSIFAHLQGVEIDFLTALKA